MPDLIVSYDRNRSGLTCLLAACQFDEVNGTLRKIIEGIPLDPYDYPKEGSYINPLFTAEIMRPETTGGACLPVTGNVKDDFLGTLLDDDKRSLSLDEALMLIAGLHGPYIEGLYVLRDRPAMLNAYSYDQWYAAVSIQRGAKRLRLVKGEDLHAYACFILSAPRTVYGADNDW